MNNKAQFFPYKDEIARHSFPYITISLIALNIIIFFWSLTNFESVINTFGFVPAAASILTIFTSMFLHGGFDHILGNMLYLWIFGDNVEDKFGKFFFIIFYLLAGIAATFTHWFTNIGSAIPAIGASGAISGVLGSYVVLFPKARIHTIGRFGLTTVSAWMMIGLWFLIQLLLGSASLFGGQGSGIAFWAHVGGFVFGFVVTLALKVSGIVKVEGKK